MKRYFFALNVIIVIFYSCNKTIKQPPKHKITVKGHIKFADPNNKFGITLNKRNENNELEVVKKIKTNVTNNYSFTLETDKPEFYILNVYKKQHVEFYGDDEDLIINFRGVDTAKIKIKNPPHVHIDGGEKNNVLNALHFANYQNYQFMIASAQTQYRASLSNSQAWKEYSEKYWNSIHEPSYERNIKNIIAMYDTYPTVIKAVQSLSWKKHQDFMVKQYERLSKKFPKVAYIQKAKSELLAKIERATKTEIGKVAPDFILPDINGKEVSLSSFKGKYVLIDFWASWCGPCRQESPNVQKQYRLYKDKGFEVVSVSIDKKIDNWKKAVKEDKMEGTLLIAQDSKKIMSDYAFSGIPYMILLDKEGKIIAKYLRGKTLQKALKELF